MAGGLAARSVGSTRLAGSCCRLAGSRGGLAAHWGVEEGQAGAAAAGGTAGGLASSSLWTVVHLPGRSQCRRPTGSRQADPAAVVRLAGASRQVREGHGGAGGGMCVCE